MITKRIKQIAAFVNKNVVAEIGADHGYITKYLFDIKKIKFAALTDISANSLQKARDNFSKTKYANKVCFSVGDGLQALQNVNNSINNKKVEQIIIAGMGAREIISILSQNTNFEHFVLQPQKNVVELRQFLINNNYKIKKDIMVKDGKIFYNVISAQKMQNCTQKLTKRQLFFGLTNTKQPNSDFCEYLNFKNLQYTQILNNSNSKSNCKNIQSKLALIKRELKKIEQKKNATM